MNIDKLIAAAEEIDRLRIKQSERTAAWQKLANDARAGIDRKETDRRRSELDAVRVVDFGSAIDKLCHALRS